MKGSASDFMRNSMYRQSYSPEIEFQHAWFTLQKGTNRSRCFAILPTHKECRTHWRVGEAFASMAAQSTSTEVLLVTTDSLKKSDLKKNDNSTLCYQVLSLHSCYDNLEEVYFHALPSLIETETDKNIFIALDSPLWSGNGLEILRRVSSVILTVELGYSSFENIHQTVALLGNERIAGVVTSDKTDKI